MVRTMTVPEVMPLFNWVYCSGSVERLWTMDLWNGSWKRCNRLYTMILTKISCAVSRNSKHIRATPITTEHASRT